MSYEERAELLADGEHPPERAIAAVRRSPSRSASAPTDSTPP
jgi:hypothetical protein